jgi:NAD(P)-dependent dehydrogenase (short-subunit alcohol dehydrogenase family)
MSLVILITGASSGLGREAALLLAEQGHHVYAGARRLDRMADLADGGITAVQMDVSVAGDNERAVHRIIEDQGRIDVLVNNAGFGLYGPIEDTPIDEARHQFEVNLFGLAHLTQLVLPHMRAQGTGRIVNISSMLGRIYMPLSAWYLATKHALEGWSDCLRLEAAPFGIGVVLIEPGSIKTEFGQAIGAQLRRLDGASPYQAQIDPFLWMLDNPGAKFRQTEARALAKLYVKAATARRPRRRYIAGKQAKPAMFTRRWFGDGVYEFMLRYAFHRPMPPRVRRETGRGG